MDNLDNDDYREKGGNFLLQGKYPHNHPCLKVTRTDAQFFTVHTRGNKNIKKLSQKFFFSENHNNLPARNPPESSPNLGVNILQLSHHLMVTALRDLSQSTLC